MVFYVYVLRCRDGSLYAGCTNNIERRLLLHQKGTASKYTRSRRPVELVAHWPFESRGAALRHELLFKSLTGKGKIKMIASSFPQERV